MSIPKKPDFSGEWVLDRQACTLSPGADAVTSSDWTIEHRDPKFKVKASAKSDTGDVKYEFELRAEEGGTTGLQWEGDALLAVFVVPGPEGEMTISFRYELIDDGRRLRAVEHLRGGGRDPQDNTWIFNRR
jgi:hypothetical protein